MKIDHASITVKDMDQSIDFYCKTLGLKLVSRREIPENKAIIAFVGGSEDKDNIGIELTFWKEKNDWTDGDQLDHIAFVIDNMRDAIEEFRRKGVEIAKEPYSLIGSKSIIAFIKDPNGIWLELIQREK
jgi:lactoylglutathione lyase